MGKFGWSLPPGCGSLPGEDAPDPHPLSEEVCGLLEDSGVDQATIDRVCKGIDELAIAATADCPRCMEEAAREMEDAERREVALHEAAEARRWAAMTDGERDAEIRDALRASNC